MPDITMCEGTGCQQRNTCHRFLAKPDEYRQAYFVTPPVEADGTCKHYWDARIRPREL